MRSSLRAGPLVVPPGTVVKTEIDRFFRGPPRIDVLRVTELNPFD
jgi:hypothetical protein